MALGIGFGAERLGTAALRFPQIALVCLIALLVLVVSSLPRLSFDDDIHRVFLSDSALSQAQLAYEAEQFPPLGTILIHVTAPDALGAQDMAMLRDLSLDLEFVDGVVAVASPFVLRWPPEEGTPSGRPLFGPQIAAEYSDDLAAFEALGTGLPTFVNQTRTAVLLSVSVDTGQISTNDAVAALKTELVRLADAGLSAAVTGEDVISAEIVAGLKDDLIELNLWGALIVSLAAFILLRDLRMALLAVVPALFGALGVLALSVWLGYPVTVLSNVIPILLLVLGVADGVHLAGHLKDQGAVADAIKTVGPACGLTALTTAIAFASITLTGNAQLFEFAVLGALGTMLSFAIVIVTFAMLGRVARLSDRPVPKISATVAQRLAQTGASRPGQITALCMVLLVVASLGFMETKAWFPLYQNLPDDSTTMATNDAIAEDFGGVFQVIIESEGGWSELQNLTQRLEAQAGPHTVLSEVNFARWLGFADRQPTAQQLETLPKALVTQLRSSETTSRVFVSVPEPMRSHQSLIYYDTLRDIAMKSGADRIIGLPAIMRQEAVSLIDQLSIGLAVAALGSTVVVAIAFRSVRLVPVLIVPNLLPLMLTGASLHLWAQGQLTPTAVLALTIAFGIAIDDTVHFLSRFGHAKAAGLSPQEAIKSAARSAGQVMVLTTLLLTCGLCVTLFSAFSPIRLFGGMMIITLWAALLIDLLLLPALLTWKRTAHAVS